MSEISAASIIHCTDEKEYITGYWQKRSTGFANLRKAELHSEKQLLWQQEITRHLPQNRSLKILDIGCGAGFFGILLGQKHSVTGIDLTPEMIEAAGHLPPQNAAAQNLRLWMPKRWTLMTQVLTL